MPPTCCRFSRPTVSILTAFLFALLSGVSHSQAVVATVSSSSLELPEDPGFHQSRLSSTSRQHREGVRPEAGPFARYILPNQPAPALTPGDKILMGFRDAVTPFSVAGWFASATYEQIANSPPNYPEDGHGYLQRVGAAVARGASKSVFTTGVFAPILHEDPRYYKLGPDYGTAHRLFYAASRVFVTRRDNGNASPNLSLLLGTLGSTSLTQAYYPPLNRGFNDLARSYGESLGASMINLSISEFFNDALEVLHFNPVVHPQ